MKHFILSVIVLCVGFVQQAKGETYNVETPGSLSALVGDDIDYLVDVTIIGTLNLADFECIWGMSKLEKLNLKEAKILGGEEYQFSYGDWAVGTKSGKLDEKKISVGLFRFNNVLKKIVLPDNIVQLDERAFWSCTTLQNVILGDRVRVLETDAFYKCSQIATINIPPSVESIGAGALSGTKLTDVVLPSGLINLEGYVFSGCTELKKIQILSKLTEIPEGLFSGCKQLADFSFPPTVTAIGNDAFRDCGFTSFDIPDNIVSIGEGTFRDCTQLRDINISSSITTLPKEVFSNCGITSLTLPDNITSIGASAFSNNSLLLSITLPKNLVVISESCFSCCSQLVEIEIPQSVTTIEKEAFSGTGFTAFTFPASVVSIGEGALSDCQSLQKVVFPEGITEIPEEVCASCISLTEFNIPKNVKRINDHAFANVPFQSVTIPENVKQVGDLVFSHQLKSVFWNSDAPIRKNSFGHWGPGLNDWDFYGVSLNALFYVSTDAESFEDCNLIRRGIAENITLHRKSDYGVCDFYCPKAFKAKKISLTRNFCLESGHGISAGWESISLPFTVTSITHAVQGKCSPFGNEDGRKHFWLKKLAASGFERATAIEAYQPYIICIPNNEAYDEEYILTGDITFSAEDEEGVLVPATPEGICSEGPLFTLYPSCSRKELDGSFYAINRSSQLDGGGHVTIPAGAVFAKRNLNNSENLGNYVFPFEAYLVTKESPAKAPMYYSIGGGDGGDITGLEDILLKENKSLNIYSIDNTLYIQTDRDREIHIYDVTGRTIRQVEAKEGVNTVIGLAKGFYFLEGKKVLIK